MTRILYALGFIFAGMSAGTLLGYPRDWTRSSAWTFKVAGVLSFMVTLSAYLLDHGVCR